MEKIILLATVVGLPLIGCRSLKNNNDVALQPVTEKVLVESKEDDNSYTSDKKAHIPFKFRARITWGGRDQ